jgi:tRNA-(ms[2]io[6]A)-hydroxylase
VVRRLPVLQSKDAEDAAAEARPRWHWIVIGAGFVITIWIPLAMMALAAGRALAGAMEHRAWAAFAVLVPVLLSFALACVAAGALVGRFGGRAGRREATLWGLLAALAAWLVAVGSGALAPWTVAMATAVVLPGLAAFFASWGGRLGVGRRPRV